MLILKIQTVNQIPTFNDKPFLEKCHGIRMTLLFKNLMCIYSMFLFLMMYDTTCSIHCFNDVWIALNIILTFSTKT